MNNRPTITAAIIARNEADNLAALLPRLDWVDEIVVVVDEGSTDATRSVAVALGARVVTRSFDTFARQRNRALAMAGGDWIFSIDADERPTPDLEMEIRHCVTRTDHAAFRVPIRSTIFGRPFRRSGTQDDRPIRLFRRDAAQWVGDVHEVLQVQGPVGQLASHLTHHTLPDRRAFQEKMDRYTALEAEARVALGQAPRIFDTWIAPAREMFRRLIWKQGFLDGPAGWRFCLLSGLSERVLAVRHRRLWKARLRSETAS